MRERTTPNGVLALIAANGLSAVAQGNFMFVLPWILLARGHSATVSGLAAAFLFVPILVTAIPAGITADRNPPRRVMGLSFLASGVAAALYPLSVLGGREAFWLILLAATVTGTARNYSEGALLRGLGDLTSGAGLLRAHAIRTTVNQAAIFGSGFCGLLLFRVGGAAAVMTFIAATQVASLVCVRLAGKRVDAGVRAARGSFTAGLASLRDNPRLRAIAWVNVVWNVFSGAALSLMPAVLREHAGLEEIAASASFIAGTIVVVVLTLPVVRTAQRRLGVTTAFVAAVVAQSAVILVFVDSRAAALAPLVYPVFLLANSSAAAALNGARALEVEPDHQGLLNLALITVGAVGFVIGVVGAAGLLDVAGFGVVLVVIAAGMAATAVGFRRPLLAS